MQNDCVNSVLDADADGWTPRVDCGVLTTECFEPATPPSQTFDRQDYAMTMPPSQPYDLALEPHAHAVREFLDRYYRTLEDAPHDAWRHYSVAAQYVHADVDPHANGGYGSTRPAVGHREIRANVVHQRFTECRFSVRTMDVQRVPCGDYVALVTGDMCRRHCPPPPHPFVQTFVVGCGGVSFDQWAITNSLLLVNYFR